MVEEHRTARDRLLREARDLVGGVPGALLLAVVEVVEVAAAEVEDLGGIDIQQNG